MRVGKLALMVPVMDAGRVRHLRQPLHRRLDLLAGDDHQIRELVDDDDDVGHGREVRLRRAGRRLGAHLRVAHAIVEDVDVAHRQPRHAPIALLHLGDSPGQRRHRLVRIGHHRAQQVRDAVVDGELQHLRVDHQEAALVGR